ncbi:MAG: methionine--tRNA ligase [Verrucomicrobiota bacterium]
MQSPEPFYITTPIYYVNDRPHIGHAYTTILADVLARYHRLLDEPVFFLTGTDEHGQKVQQAADKNRITPQQQCDQTVVRFQELWKKLDITHDSFIRTTQDDHKQVVQRILQNLYDRDEIYPADYEGWYCVPCERFFTEKDLLDGQCPECRRDVQQLIERNYFFRMSRYQQWLIDYIEEHPEFIQPEHRRQETLGFLRRPLNDLCISRPKSRLNWGIELPFDADYVTYVWFDALVNYISGIGYTNDEERFRRWWPADYHLIGKDILTTHTVYWPTMLKAMGVEMPRTIFAHGWWLVGRDKMSKSLGNVVNPMDMAEEFGVDAFRYFLIAEMTLGQDASFTREGFITRYNADLANDLGNFASRVLKMISRNANGRLPPPVSPGDAEKDLVDAVLGAVSGMETSLRSMQLDRGVAEVMNAVRAGNRYFEQTAPWELVKQGKTDDLNRVLYHGAECLRIVSGLLFPIMPEKMTILRETLGLTEAEIRPHIGRLAQWNELTEGREVRKLKALFPRVDRNREPAPPATEAKPPGEPATPAKTEKAAPEGTVDLIEIGTFAQVDLRVAVVTSAEPVPKADRLLRLDIDLGTETRQLVAGIAQHYEPQDLPGRRIVVVANLKPTKLKGVESQGMLLAAKAGKNLSLLTVDDSSIPPGTKIG